MLYNVSEQNLLTTLHWSLLVNMVFISALTAGWKKIIPFLSLLTWVVIIIVFPVLFIC